MSDQLEATPVRVLLEHLQPAYADLVAETLPAEHRDAWELAIHGAETQEEADAVWALEDWVTKPLQR